MAVRLRDVAELAGVSTQTASHCLGDLASRYAGATRARVESAASALGYRPHASARAMRSGRFGGLALLLSNVPYRSNLPSGLLWGIQEALAARDLRLTLDRVPDERLVADGYLPKMLREWSADGLLINIHHGIPAAFDQLLERDRLPSVWLNLDRPQDAVLPDDRQGGRLAGEHLVALGHRRIAYSGIVNSDHYSVAERLAGLCEAVAGSAAVAVLEHDGAGPTTSERWMSLAAAWRRDPHRPTAVVTYSNKAACAARVALLSAGLRVPDDVSIVTFGDQLEDDEWFAVTTCVLPQVELGRAAVEMLLQRVASPEEHQPSRRLALTLAMGGTSGRAPARRDAAVQE